jgi:hypothetical protein
MKSEMKILLDRIRNFGAMWMADEHGSYIEGETERLLLALTDDECRELCRLESDEQNRRKALIVA